MSQLAMLLPLLFLIISAGASYRIWVNYTSRRALHLMDEKVSHKSLIPTNTTTIPRSDLVISQYLKVILGGTGALLASYFFARSSFAGSVIFGGGVAGAIAIFFSRKNGNGDIVAKNRNITFFLPTVMERLVMAVQAGLDVVPALETVTNIGLTEAKDENRRIDPVTELLDSVMMLHASGQTLQTALEEVAKTTTSIAVRHAFIHLALAHQEGGELIVPLRELSDATQLYYQESIEEEIALLPMKATLPLLATFAGLILCFLTIPLVQVLLLTSQQVK